VRGVFLVKSESIVRSVFIKEIEAVTEEIVVYEIFIYRLPSQPDRDLLDRKADR
jgi:hypothetical protein